MFQVAMEISILDQNDNSSQEKRCFSFIMLCNGTQESQF